MYFGKERVVGTVTYHILLLGSSHFILVLSLCSQQGISPTRLNLHQLFIPRIFQHLDLIQKFLVRALMQGRQLSLQLLQRAPKIRLSRVQEFGVERRQLVTYLSPFLLSF